MTVVLITGAAGKVGRLIRPTLAEHYTLRMLDRVPIHDDPQAIVGDINDDAVLDRAMSGVDAVVHLAGAASPRASFDDVLRANIEGTYHLYEAARRNGVSRVVFASTNRTVENHSPLRSHPHRREDDVFPVEYPLSPLVAPRPDSLYGVSKLFGENLARYYADEFGVTSVCVRLGSVTTKPDDPYLAKPRAWALWMSQEDLAELFHRSIEADGVGCAIVYGSSANTRRWWDLEHARELIGFVPRDDSESMVASWTVGGGAVAPTTRHLGRQRLDALTASPGGCTLVWLGQSGFYVALPDGPKIAIDPFLTMWPDRLQEPLLDASELPADLVLVTHTHRDHLDKYALPVIAARHPQTLFITPPTGRDKLCGLGIDADRVISLQPGQIYEDRSVTVTAVEARHRPSAPDAQGYVIRSPGHSIFHTGDTEYDPCLVNAETMRADVLLVPINGRGGNMTAEQAARLAGELEVRAVVPMHFGCLQPQEDLVARFLAESSRLSPNVAVSVMEPGTIAMLPGGASAGNMGRS